MTLLERNLARLARTSAPLERRLRAAEPSSRVQPHTGRSGLPSVSMAGERQTAVHSKVDPVREALRLVQNSNAEGFVLVFGLGLGYHLRELLQRADVTLVLVIDYDLSVVRSFLEAADLTDLFSDPRLAVLVDPAESELESWILTRYVPVLHGNVSGLTLRGRVEQDPDAFAAARRTALAAAHAAADDVATQRAFGRNWMRNIALNVISLANHETSARGGGSENLLLERAVLQAAQRSERCIITAAGPSLDRNLELIRSKRRRSLLIATDSSLPALVAAELQPDLVLAIDCQVVSYLHLLGAGTALQRGETLLVADIGVHHALARTVPAVCFVGGNHPLVRYLVGRGLRLPFLDTSDGSVTHAAVRLAAALCLRKINVYGADFSYPRAASYARGTYLHSHFLHRHARRDPLSSRLLQFVFDRPDVEVVRREGRPVYITALMQRYRERYRDVLHTFAENARQPHPGRQRQMPFLSCPADRGERPPGPPGRVLLETYLDALRALPLPRAPLWRYLAEQSPTEQNVLRTLLPLAAACRCDQFASGSAERLEETRREAIELIAPLLQATHPSGHMNAIVP